MPLAYADKVPMLKAYIRGKFKKARISVVSVYGKNIPAQNLSHQTIVWIANTIPKLVEPRDRVYVLSVNNPVLMAFISCRITRKLSRFEMKKQRQWRLLEYDPKTKSFVEYYLP